MKRFSTLFFILFAVSVFIPIGYGQFQPEDPPEDPPGVPDRSFLDVTIKVSSDVQNGAFNARIRFIEEVLDFVQSDVVLAGTATASITGWVSTEDVIFIATITPVTSGTVIISVPADVATDGGGNQNNAATPQTVTVDVDAPSVGITVPSVAQSGAFEATITFTESVSDFEQADLTLSGTATATVTAWDTTDNTVFTATITPTTEGEVVLSVAADVATDAASNNNTASETQTVTVDMTPPGVSLSVPEGAQNGAFDVTITFTEAVSGFEQADLSVSGTATTSITAWTTTDNTVFTATITPTTSGTVILNIAAEVATDAANNNNTASETQTVTIDVDAPGVSISVPTDAQSDAFEATITFTEVVSGFEQADLTLSGTATASITAWTTTDDTTYTTTITPTVSGTLTLSIAAGAVTDTAGNTNVLSTAEVNITLNVADAFVSVCDRTPQVRDAIVAALPNVSDCANVTAADLATITSLNIPNQNITALKEGDFNGLTVLEQLYLYENALSSLPAGIFDDLTALTRLSLSNNALSSLPAGIFDDLTALEELYLYKNALSSLPARIFDDLTALEELYLYKNALSSLPAGIFDDLTALEHLWLSNNELSLPAGIFDDLTALEYLSLSNNKLSSLPVGIFEGLTALTQLYLHDNDLSSLPVGIFDDLTALTQLYLYDNDLSSLPVGIFEGLTTLTRLWLSKNELSSLPAGIFEGLTALTQLYLYENDLSSLPAGIFKGLTALTQLYLYENELSSLPVGIFEGLTALEKLYLPDNTVDPLSLTVSLKQIEAGQFKATVHTGALPNMTVTVSVVNGSIDGGSNSIPIPRGKIESETFTVTRTTGTTDAVSVDIETLPQVSRFAGYEYVKSTDLPLTVIDALGNAAPRRIPVDAVPSETALSANYPNPFNPETWIPYQLSNTSDVKITIYDVQGRVVRELDLGHQRAGYYTSRSRAAYWDGRNNRGERVASGIYFYQLQADNISLLRKMVILQ